VRLVLFFVLFVFFVGFIFHSLVNVRYDVSGKAQSESYVLKKSTTHSIERNREGSFVDTVRPESSLDTAEPLVETGIVVPGKQPAEIEEQPCPT